nr:sodium:proton antiporter [uncultured bacterium]
MDYFAIATILVVLSAIFGYINIKFFKLPDTIGLMVITISFTLVVLLISYFFDDTLLLKEKEFIASIDFETVLLDIMLSFLLFAGALHTNFQQLRIQRKPILIFATLGTLVSTFLAGIFVYYILNFLGLNVDFIYCLLFGALISPTDPIAVLGIMKNVGAPKNLETKIVGESLFNDGVGVVIFLTIYQIAKGGADISVGHIAELFLVEVIGGIALGLAIGWITYRLMKSIDDYDIEVIITLAAVMGGTLLAQQFHLSAPLAMVTTGLIVGADKVRESSMSKITEQYVDKFWELIDVLLNTVLFVMIGMEILVLTFDQTYIIAGIITIPLLLIARYLSLLLPIKIYAKKLDFVPKTNLIMTWGGLRGGISIALALSLTPLMERDLFLVITYIIVVFSIIVQGLTVGKLIKKYA